MAWVRMRQRMWWRRLENSAQEAQEFLRHSGLRAEDIEELVGLHAPPTKRLIQWAKLKAKAKARPTAQESQSFVPRLS